MPMKFPSSMVTTAQKPKPWCSKCVSMRSTMASLSSRARAPGRASDATAGVVQVVNDPHQAGGTPDQFARRRPERPDSAALEVGHCLLTLSHAHAAVKQPAAAATDLEGGLKLLDDAFPNAAAARAARVDEPEEQRADQQEVSVPPSRRAAGGNGSGSSSNAASSSKEEEGSSGSAEADVNVQAAANLAKAVSAKEAARAQRVEQARKQLACSMLAELLVLAGGGEADLAAVQERWAQEGCAAS